MGWPRWPEDLGEQVGWPEDLGEQVGCCTAEATTQVSGCPMGEALHPHNQLRGRCRRPWASPALTGFGQGAQAWPGLKVRNGWSSLDRCPHLRMTPGCSWQGVL